MSLLFALIGRFFTYVAGSNLSGWLWKFLCSPHPFNWADIDFTGHWLLVWLIGFALLLAHRNSNK